MANQISMYTKGSYQDTLIWDSMNGFTKTEVRPRMTNQIQDYSLLSIRERLTGASENPTNFWQYWGPIRFMHLGQGNSSWDTASPSKPVDQNDLEDYVYAKSIVATDFTLNGGLSVNTNGQTITSFTLQVTIGSDEANGYSLREFGLFTGSSNSLRFHRSMFNWVDHPVIEKDSSLQIVRLVDIEIGITRS